MFRFAHPEYLLLLLIIPLLLIVFALSVMRKRKLLAKIGNVDLMSQLMPDVSHRRGWLKIILFCLAILCVVVALSRPQTGAKVKETSRKGVEVMIALDVSNSMLAQDYKPNRLERAKLSLSRLVDKLHNDRIGLIVFAGNAFVQLPITSDYVSAKIFLKSINPGIVATQGTNFAKAIELAMRSFTENSEKSRALIIISDGEDQEEGAITAAQEAAKQGIVIHTIGIGSTKGELIKMPDGNFLKDKDGNMVVTRLNENVLQSIAAETKGGYILASNVDLGLEKIIDNIHSMEKKELNAVVYDEYREWFMYFLLLALVFVVAELLISDRKNKWLNSIDIFQRKKNRK